MKSVYYRAAERLFERPCHEQSCHAIADAVQLDGFDVKVSEALFKYRYLFSPVAIESPVETFFIGHYKYHWWNGEYTKKNKLTRSLALLLMHEMSKEQN